MSDSDIDDDWLAFSSQIEVVLLVEKKCLDKTVNKNIFQHVLLMQFCKNDDSDIISINLVNMIKFRSVISLITHFVKLIK